MKRNRQFQLSAFQEEWTCPITSMVMVDPVSTVDGHSYQKKQIVEWLAKKNTSPKTGLQLTSNQVIPNIALKCVIHKYQTQVKYEFNKICSENNQLSQKVQKLEPKIKQLLKEKIKIQNECKQLKGNYSTLLSSSKKVGDSFLLSKNENQTLKTENLNLKTENLNLKTENLNLKTENKSVQIFKSQNQLLKVSKQTLQLQIKKLTTQNLTLSSKKIQDQTLKLENQSLKSENLKLKTQIQTLKTQNNAVIGLRSQNQDLKTQNQVILLQLNRLQQQISSHQPLINKIKNGLDPNQVQRYKIQTNGYKILNNNLKTQIKDASEQIVKLGIQKERLKRSLALAEQKIKDQQKQKQKLLIHQPYRIPQKIEKMNEQKPFNQINFNRLMSNQKQNPAIISASSQSNQQYKVNPCHASNNSFPFVYEAPKPWAPEIRFKPKFAANSNSLFQKSLQNLQSKTNEIKEYFNAAKQNTINTLSMADKLHQNTQMLKGLFWFNASASNEQIKEKQKTESVPELKNVGILKPVQLNPPSNINSSVNPPYNPFHSLIRSSVNQKVQKMQAQSRNVKHTLPFSDYLHKNPVLYDEQKRQLDHSGYKINMEEFLKYDWTHLTTLNISDAQIDDKAIQMFVNQAIYYVHLQDLWLWNNMIVNLPKFALERYKSLKTVFFSLKGRYPNPLNQASRIYMKSFQTRNPSIKVSYDNKTE